MIICDFTRIQLFKFYLTVCAGFMTYLLHLRKKALKYLDTVGNRQKVVEAFNASLRTLERWICRRHQNYSPGKQRKSSPSKIDDPQLRLFIPKHRDAYLREIAEKIGTTLQVGFYACKRLKISLKKTRIHRRAGKNS